MSKKKQVPYSTYKLVFEWVPNDGTDAGFAFDCDAVGNPLPFKCVEAENNYKLCISGNPEIAFKCIREYHHMPNYGTTVWELLLNPFAKDVKCGNLL